VGGSRGIVEMIYPDNLQHMMVFDKPFLVLLKRVGAKTPYLALWVDNSELLVPYD